MQKFKKSITMDIEDQTAATTIKINSKDASKFMPSPRSNFNYKKSASSETTPKQARFSSLASQFRKKRKKLKPKYNLKRKSVKKNFLDLDLNLASTEEKIKAYYKAKEDIANPKRYKKRIMKKEEENLSRDLGIDIDLEKTKYGFFLEMCLNAKLPNGWSKELGKDETMYYFNRKDGSYSYEHPCLSSFRQLMNNEYKKVLRGFKRNIAEGEPPKYLNKNGILSDLALYNIGRFMTFGKKKNHVFLREQLSRDLLKIYEDSYSYDFDILLKQLKQMKPMKTASYDETVDALTLFPIHQKEYYLVWIVRLYVSLPLPDYWEKRLEKSDSGTSVVYMNWNTKNKIKVRPCFFYILKLLDYAKMDKESVEKSKMIARVWMVEGLNHVFEDGFSRIYVVENEKLFRKTLVEKTNENIGLLGKGILSMFKLKKDRVIVKKRKDEILSDPFVDKVERYMNNPDLQDKHLLLICDQLRLDYNNMENAHLLFFIFNFILKQSRESHWNFRCPQKGEYYWINHHMKRISAIYPFLEELHQALEDHREKIEFRSLNNKFKNLENYRKITDSKTDRETVKKINDIRSKFVEQ